MIKVCKDGKKKYQSLRVSVNPAYWDFKKNRPKANCPNKEYINKIIADKENDFTEQIVQLKSERKQFTINSLIEKSTKKVQPKTVNDVFLEQIQRLTDESRHGYILSTKEVYNSLMEFKKKKINQDGNQEGLSSINLECKTKNPNTIAKGKIYSSMKPTIQSEERPNPKFAHFFHSSKYKSYPKSKFLYRKCIKTQKKKRPKW